MNHVTMPGDWVGYSFVAGEHSASPKIADVDSLPVSAQWLCVAATIRTNSLRVPHIARYETRSKWRRTTIVGIPKQPRKVIKSIKGRKACHWKTRGETIRYPFLGN